MKRSLLLLLAASFALAASAAPVRVHVVQPGETLFLIASRELGDGNRWTEIAKLNGIADPSQLRTGASLRLPDAGRLSSDSMPRAVMPPTASPLHEPLPPLPPVIGPAPETVRFAPDERDPWLADNTVDRDPALEHLIAQAYQSSPVLAKAEAAVSGGEAQTRAALSAYWPQLGASERFTSTDNPPLAFMSILNQGRFTQASMNTINSPGTVQDWTTSLYARALLFDFGGRSGQVDAARANEQRLRWLTRAARRDVRFNVRSAYYQGQAALAAVSLWEETVRLYEENERLAQAHYAAGVAMRSDLLSVQVRLGDARENLVAARNRVEVCRNALVAAVGRPRGEIALEPRPLASPRYNGDEERIVVATRAAHPALSAFAEAERSAAAMERAAKSQNLPVVVAQVQGDWHGDDESFGAERGSATAAVAVEFPFFDGWRAQAARDEARAKQSEIAAARREVADQLEAAARNAHRQTEEALGRIAIADTAVVAAREALAIVTERYKAGLVRIVDLLDAQRALTEARQRALNARAAAWTALAALELVASKEGEE